MADRGALPSHVLLAGLSSLHLAPDLVYLSEAGLSGLVDTQVAQIERGGGGMRGRVGVGGRKRGSAGSGGVLGSRGERGGGDGRGGRSAVLG